MAPSLHRPDTPRSSLSPAERPALARFRAGDESAFQDLLRPQLGALRAFARRSLADVHRADDALQETLIRAYRGLSGFRGDSGLRSWLFTILARVLADRGRSPARGGLSLEEVEVPSHFEDPLADARERELRERLDEAVERLTARQRSAFHLRAVEGYGYRSIAEILTCSEPAARMLVLEARKKVMARLGRHLEP